MQILKKCYLLLPLLGTILRLPLMIYTLVQPFTVGGICNFFSNQWDMAKLIGYHSCDDITLYDEGKEISEMSLRSLIS